MAKIYIFKFQSPHLAPEQRRDVKEDGYDTIEPSIQVTETSPLTDGEKKKDSVTCFLVSNKRALAIGALGAALLGTFVYFKLR